MIGRLAQRFDVSVKLTASPSGGVTALVTLPADLVTYEGEELPAAAARARPGRGRRSPSAAAEDEFVDLDDDELVILDDDTDDLVVIDDDVTRRATTTTSTWPRPSSTPRSLDDDDLLDELVEEGMSDTDEFERGLQSIISDELAPGPGRVRHPRRVALRARLGPRRLRLGHHRRRGRRPRSAPRSPSRPRSRSPSRSPAAAPNR